MSQTHERLNQFLFKKTKLFAKKQNLYIQVITLALKARKITNIPEEEWFLERLFNKDYAETKLNRIVNEATSLAKKEAVESTFYSVTGFFPSGGDHITGSTYFKNQKNNGGFLPFLCTEIEIPVFKGSEKVREIRKGQIIPLLNWNSSNVKFSVDSKLAINSQRKIPIPYMTLCTIRIQEQDDPQWGLQYSLKYIESIAPDQRLTLPQMQRAALSNSITLSLLNKELKDKYFFFRNIRWNKMSAHAIWQKTGTIEIERESTSTDGSVEIKTDAQGNPVKETQDKIEAAKVGQPFMQVKFGKEETGERQATFQLQVYDDSNSKNQVTFNLWNYQHGEPIIWVSDFQYTLDRAEQLFGLINTPDDEDQDPFNYINNIMKGTDLLIGGKITYIKEIQGNDGNTRIKTGINVTFISNLRFPYLEKEDLPMPPLAQDLLAAVPNGKDIIKDIGKAADLEFSKPMPTDVDLDFTGVIEKEDELPDELPEGLEAEVLSSTDEYKATEQEVSISDSLKEIFKSHLELLNNAFKKRTIISKKDLEEMFVLKNNKTGDDLGYELMETANIWSPNNPGEYELADEDVGIVADPEGRLFKFWRENILVEEAEVTVETEPPKSVGVIEAVKTSPDVVDIPEADKPQLMFASASPPYPFEVEDKTFDTWVNHALQNFDEFGKAAIKSFQPYEIVEAFIDSTMCDTDGEFIQISEDKWRKKQGMAWLKLNGGLSMLYEKTKVVEPEKKNDPVVPPVEIKETTGSKPTKQATLFADVGNDALKGIIKQSAEEIEQAKKIPEVTYQKHKFSFYVAEKNNFMMIWKTVFHRLFQSNGEAFVREFSQQSLHWLVVKGLANISNEHEDVIMLNEVEGMTQEKFNNLLSNHIGLNGTDIFHYFPNIEVEWKTDDKPVVSEAHEEKVLSIYTPEFVAKLKGKELHNTARILNIAGRSKLKVEELRKAILDHSNKDEAAFDTNVQPISNDTTPVEPSAQSPTVLDPQVAALSLSPKEKEELDDLEESIKDWLKNSPTQNFTFDELFHNYKGFLPTWITEAHKAIVDLMIEKVMKAEKA